MDELAQPASPDGPVFYEDSMNWLREEALSSWEYLRITIKLLLPTAFYPGLCWPL